ncbi:hypothetical protein [Streptomyces flaveolus]
MGAAGPRPRPQGRLAPNGLEPLMRALYLLAMAWPLVVVAYLVGRHFA